MATPEKVLECVVNVSEGRDDPVLAALAASAGPALLDLHRDPHHHRAVYTLVAPADDLVAATRSLARTTLEHLDLRAHDGVHPRLGVLDVVPFVPYAPHHRAPTDLTTAIALRDDFARWLADELDVPSFLYGPLPGGRTRALPEIRRHAFELTAGLVPDFGPPRAHSSAGATAVGARRVLVAYNVWVSSLDAARHAAALVRGPEVRALALAVGERAQVSCNLIDPDAYGPDRLYDTVRNLVAEAGGTVQGAELVGLVPQRVLVAVPRAHWGELGLSEEATVESRLAAVGG